jgi:hypothetical protein
LGKKGALLCDKNIKDSSNLKLIAGVQKYLDVQLSGYQ